MDRRHLLGIVGGAALTITVPYLPSRGRLSFGDVERLRAPLAELTAIDDRIGGADLAQAADLQAQRIRRAIERFEVTDKIERALYSLAGEYMATACVHSGVRLTCGDAGGGVP